jgi:hypothetical protein
MNPIRLRDFEQTLKIGNWTDEPCWYVSVQDAGRTQTVLGPFRTESACREWAYCDSQGATDSEPGGNTHNHMRLVRIAEKLDAKSWFYSWGMVKLQTGHREGILNKYVRTDGLWTGEPFEIVEESAS